MTDEHEERAAIMEYDAGVPREAAERLASGLPLPVAGREIVARNRERLRARVDDLRSQGMGISEIVGRLHEFGLGLGLWAEEIEEDIGTPLPPDPQGGPWRQRVVAEPPDGT